AVQAAAAHLKFRFVGKLERDRTEGPVRAARVHADQPCATIGGQREADVLHPGRPKDMIGEEIAEPLAAYPFDRLSDPVDVDAVVPSLARVEDQRQHQRRVLAGDDAGYAFLRHIAAHLWVPNVVDKARSMGDELPQGDRPSRRAQPWLTGRVEAFEY